MNALTLVAAQLGRRPLQTALGVVLLALGIGTLVFVVLLQGQLSRQLTRDAHGIDLVVGAKGSPLQLILSAVYHVDVPTGNIAARYDRTVARQPAGCVGHSRSRWAITIAAFASSAPNRL
jgi:putative ABC transport system permease protein